jgi:hypothetical protein
MNSYATQGCQKQVQESIQMLNFTLDNKKETHVFISPDQRFGL